MLKLARFGSLPRVGVTLLRKRKWNDELQHPKRTEHRPEVRCDVITRKASRASFRFMPRDSLDDGEHLQREEPRGDDASQHASEQLQQQEKVREGYVAEQTLPQCNKRQEVEAT